MYTAIIIDMVGSKKYSPSERKFVQYSILEVSQQLNSVFSKALEKEVYFSAGDEIQGLFKSSAAAYIYCRLFMLLMYPIKFRCGIGSGSWDTRLKNEATTAQDGVAYQRARTAEESVDRLSSGNLLYYSGEDNDSLVNALLCGISEIEEQQSAYQKKMQLLVELMNPFDIGIINRQAFKKLLPMAFERNNKGPFEKAKGKGESLLAELNLKKAVMNVLDLSSQDGAFFVTETISRGVITDIANATGKSRQVISKTLKDAGGIAGIRSSAASVIIYLNKRDGERENV